MIPCRTNFQVGNYNIAKHNLQIKQMMQECFHLFETLLLSFGSSLFLAIIVKYILREKDKYQVHTLYIRIFLSQAHYVSKLL